jgi:hypothetical protein
LLFSTFVPTWKKKTQGDLLALCICYYKLKDKGGALQKKLLQNDIDTKECALLSPKYWLVLYLQEKEEEEGCNAFPFLYVETNNNMGGMVCSQHFILHEHNKIQTSFFPPKPNHTPFKTKKKKKKNFFKKKKKKKKKTQFFFFEMPMVCYKQQETRFLLL